MKKIFVFIFINTLVLFQFSSLKAQLQNIQISPASFTGDIVANGNGTSLSSTTTDIDDAGYIFVNSDFNPGSGVCTGSGLYWPSTINSLITSGLTYNLQAANTNNAFQVASNSSGTLNLATSVAASNLYVLYCSSITSSGILPSVTVNFTDATSQTFSNISVVNWCTVGSNKATTIFNRTTRNTSTTCNVATCQYMQQMILSIDIANQSKYIASITFNNSTGKLSVFALGGNVLNTPTLIPTPTSLAFNYVQYGNTSTEQSFSLSGGFLNSNGSITVNAPTGFSVSLTSNSSYSNSITIPYSGNTLSSTTIYVTFTPVAANAIYASNITISGGGATSSISVTGTSLLIIGTPAAQIKLCNDTLLDARNYQFDVYIRAKDINNTTSFDLANYQFSFQDSLKNVKGSGTASVSIVSGNSELPTNLQFSTVFLKPILANPLYISTGVPNNATPGTKIIYDSTNPTSPGWVRTYTLRITNSNYDFLQAKMNVNFYYSGTSYPLNVYANYAAILAGKIPITDTLNFLRNPVINGVINQYNISCLGNTVFLNGSQTGVIYQLKKDNIPYGAAIVGTGSSINWTGLVSGNYTITAHRVATYMYADMLGFINLEFFLYNVTGGGNYCLGGTLQTIGLSGSQIGVDYQLLQNGNNFGNVIAGTGSTLIWTNITDASGSPATYQIKAIKNESSQIMNGSAIVTSYPIPSTPVVVVLNNCGNSVLSTNAIGKLLWSTGDTTSSITITNAGTYTVTTTINTCTSLAGSGIANPKTIPSTPIVNVQNNCGNSVLSTFATGKLLWSTGDTTSSIIVTNAGTYTITSTINGCTSVTGSGIANPIFAPVVSVQNNCGNSVLSTNANGKLLWSTGDTTSSITVTNAGIYSVTTTINGCTSQSGSNVANPKSIPSTPVVSVQNNCGNSVLSTNATGTLLWNTGASTTSITVTNAGVYTIATTINGCTSAAGNGVATPKTIPSTPIISIQNNCGKSVLSTNATGILLWNTGDTTSLITVTNAGTYTVTTTINSCTSIAGSGLALPKNIFACPENIFALMKIFFA